MMFISLGLSNDIVDAVMDKQGYNTPHALSCLDKKGVEMAICNLGWMKSGTQNPAALMFFFDPRRLLWVHALPSSTSDAVAMGGKSQLHYPRRFKELWLQQEIKKAHNNKVAYGN